MAYTYHKRLIDKYLKEWANESPHKPLLLRGARQVGKSTAVRNLGRSFSNFVEINFEKNPEYGTLFDQNLDISRIVPQLEALAQKQIIPGKTLLFFDEIQFCPKAIMSLRFFKEDLPSLHLIAAGSLLEFVLDELPTFGVGRIRSIYMYPMTFDEFLMANGQESIKKLRDDCDTKNPLSTPLHQKLTELFRTYMMVGGMPEVVGEWVKNHDFLKCQKLQDDIINGYTADFAKYKKSVNPVLLRNILQSVAHQISKKFVYSKVNGDFKIPEIKVGLRLLSMAGLIIPTIRCSANGIPLGAETDESFVKYLILDSGIELRLLNMTLASSSQLATDILTMNARDLVNKGEITEMTAGLELLHYQNPTLKNELYYWLRPSRNSDAEIDYLCVDERKIVPIEVKAETQGGMKSLWIFMHDKKLNLGVRTSLENFGKLIYTDTTAITKEHPMGEERKIAICPLYSLSNLSKVISSLADFS